MQGSFSYASLIWLGTRYSPTLFSNLASSLSPDHFHEASPHLLLLVKLDAKVRLVNLEWCTRGEGGFFQNFTVPVCVIITPPKVALLRYPLLATTLHQLLRTISIFLAGDQLVVPIGASHISLRLQEIQSREWEKKNKRTIRAWG